MPTNQSTRAESRLGVTAAILLRELGSRDAALKYAERYARTCTRPAMADEYARAASELREYRED